MDIQTNLLTILNLLEKRMEIKLTQLAKELMASSIVDPDNPVLIATFVPVRATSESAGYDLRACIEEPIKIRFGETVIIPCGFHLHINDPNIVGKLYVRSSVGTKLGLVLANGTGIIDSDYQDEWKLAIKNTHDCERTIYPAQRLAHVVFTQAIHPKTFDLVGEFSEQSERFGGFGSTNGERR